MKRKQVEIMELKSTAHNNGKGHFPGSSRRGLRRQKSESANWQTRRLRLSSMKKQKGKIKEKVKRNSETIRYWFEVMKMFWN